MFAPSPALAEAGTKDEVDPSPDLVVSSPCFRVGRARPALWVWSH